MMTQHRRLATAALVLALALPASAQTTRQHVETLASEKLAGREAGSPGERAAADYIAAQLRRLGARPLPGRSDMFVPFEFVAGSRDGGSRVTVRGSVRASGIRALSFSDDAEVTG